MTRPRPPRQHRRRRHPRRQRPTTLTSSRSASWSPDEPAYKTAMLDVVKQSMSIHLLQVDNIVVKGDTATADVLLTQRLGNQPADTKSTPATLVPIDGNWLDCTPPAKQ